MLAKPPLPKRGKPVRCGESAKAPCTNAGLNHKEVELKLMSAILDCTSSTHVDAPADEASRTMQAKPPPPKRGIPVRCGKSIMARCTVGLDPNEVEHTSAITLHIIAKVWQKHTCPTTNHFGCIWRFMGLGFLFVLLLKSASNVAFSIFASKTKRKWAPHCTGQWAESKCT